MLQDGAATYTPGLSERRSGVSKFYHGDLLGSTRAITNSSQTTTDTAVFDGFGMVVSRTGTTPTPFGYAGGWQYQADGDSGLMLLGNRYYDSSTGRFISRDPIKDGMNWYAYCGNNPLRFVDPLGFGPLNGQGSVYNGTPFMQWVLVTFEPGHAKPHPYNGPGGQVGTVVLPGGHPEPRPIYPGPWAGSPTYVVPIYPGEIIGGSEHGDVEGGYVPGIGWYKNPGALPGGFLGYTGLGSFSYDPDDDFSYFKPAPGRGSGEILPGTGSLIPPTAKPKPPPVWPTPGKDPAPGKGPGKKPGYTKPGRKPGKKPAPPGCGAGGKPIMK